MEAILVFADGRTERVNDCGGALWWIRPEIVAPGQADTVPAYPYRTGEPRQVERYFRQVDSASGPDRETLVYVEQPKTVFDGGSPSGSDPTDT